MTPCGPLLIEQALSTACSSHSPNALQAALSSASQLCAAPDRHVSPLELIISVTRSVRRETVLHSVLHGQGELALADDISSLFRLNPSHPSLDCGPWWRVLGTERFCACADPAGHVSRRPLTDSDTTKRKRGIVLSAPSRVRHATNSVRWNIPSSKTGLKAGLILKTKPART